MAEQKEEAPSVRISYFGIQGRGGPLRAAATIGGLSYEDRFVSGAENMESKKAGKNRWSGIPELTIFGKDGKELVTIGQSNTCLRYIGSLAGLYSDNPLNAALMDECLDSVEDIMMMLTPSFREKDEEKKKAMRLALMEPDKLPYWIQKFESRYEENEKRGNKNGFVVGDSLSIADLKIFFMLQTVRGGKLDYVDGNKLMENAKRMTASADKIANMDTMKKYFADFEAAQKDSKENKTKLFKKAGKGSYGSL